MRLKTHDYSEEGYYFLTICTKGRKCVLSEIICGSDNAATVRLTEYGEAAERYIKTVPGIDKYVIMPNHVHLIIYKTNGKSVSSDIRSFKGLTTKAIGESIWQETFYDHIIRNERDYQEKKQPYKMEDAHNAGVN